MYSLLTHLMKIFLLKKLTFLNSYAKKIKQKYIFKYLFLGYFFKNANLSEHKCTYLKI